MKLNLWMVIFFLVVIIILMILFRRQSDNGKEKELQGKIELRDQEISKLHQEALVLTDKIKSDSVKQSGDRATFQNAIGTLQARLRVKRVEIDTLILDNPALANYVAAADSVIQIQGERINSLEGNLKELRVDIAGLNFNFQERLDLQSATISDLTKVSEDQRKQLRKTRRSVKLLKIVAIVGTVGGIFLGGQF